MDSTLKRGKGVPGKTVRRDFKNARSKSILPTFNPERKRQI